MAAQDHFCSFSFEAGGLDSVLLGDRGFSERSRLLLAEWLRAAAQTQMSQPVGDADAVVLFDEHITTVDFSGEIKTLYVGPARFCVQPVGSSEPLSCFSTAKPASRT